MRGGLPRGGLTSLMIDNGTLSQRGDGGWGE